MKKDVRNARFCMIYLWARWCTAYPTTMASRHDAECFILAPRCGYCLVWCCLIVSVRFFFLLKEGSTFCK